MLIQLSIAMLHHTSSRLYCLLESHSFGQLCRTLGHSFLMWCYKEKMIKFKNTTMEYPYLKLLGGDTFSTVLTWLWSHWAVHLLVSGQDQILDILAALGTLHRPVLTHWQVSLCVRIQISHMKCLPFVTPLCWTLTPLLRPHTINHTNATILRSQLIFLPQDFSGYQSICSHSSRRNSRLPYLIFLSCRHYLQTRCLDKSPPCQVGKLVASSSK